MKRPRAKQERSGRKQQNISSFGFTLCGTPSETGAVHSARPGRREAEIEIEYAPLYTQGQNA